jgi:hypothetical protein
MQLGAILQVLACGVLLMATRMAALSLVSLAVFWCVFCGALAVRGPSAFSEALALPTAQIGRASAMLVLAILLAGALGTQVIAPLLDDPSGTRLRLACSHSAWRACFASRPIQFRKAWARASFSAGAPRQSTWPPAARDIA